MRKWWVIWPLYAGLMGFALGASFFFALYGRNVTESSIASQHEQHSASETAKSKKDETDEALSYYTLWLMAFTGVLAFATVGLGIATVLLYGTGEKQFRFAIRSSVRQSRETRESLSIAKQSTQTAIQHLDSIVRAERPHVFLEIVEPGVRLDSSGKLQFGDLRLRFCLNNYGRTPAILLELKEVLTVIEGRADVPNPIDPMKERGRLLPTGAVVGANRSGTIMAKNLMTETINFDRLLDQNAWITCRLFFIGYIRFADAFGSYYVTGFQFAFSPVHNAWALRGGEKYNYTRQEDPTEILPHPDYPNESI